MLSCVTYGTRPTTKEVERFVCWVPVVENRWQHAREKRTVQGPHVEALRRSRRAVGGVGVLALGWVHVPIVHAFWSLLLLRLSLVVAVVAVIAVVVVVGCLMLLVL